MGDTAHYAIRGGVQGRERLRVLSRVMHGCSSALFDRLDLRDGLACLDVGCGGGDTTLELARRVAPPDARSAPTSTKPSWPWRATRPGRRGLRTSSSARSMSAPPTVNRRSIASTRAFCSRT